MFVCACVCVCVCSHRSESVRGGNPIPHTHFTISSVLCGDNISSVCDHQDTQCESHQPLNSATHEQPTTHRVDDTQHAVTKSQSQSYQDNIDHLIEATITRALTHTAPTHMAPTHTAQESGELDTSAPGSETAGTMCDLDTQQQICETICHQGSTDNTQAMRPVSQCAGKSEDTMRVCESGSSESDSESEGESESDDEEEVMILSKKVRETRVCVCVCDMQYGLLQLISVLTSISVSASPYPHVRVCVCLTYRLPPSIWMPSSSSLSCYTWEGNCLR